ncbi:MAG TPA: hemolysin III family protein, partial [Mycobacterium sp.]|nr:hemolysin III family protein [Mycobacterium sp.]
MTTRVDTTDPRRSQSTDSRDAEDFPEAVVDAAVDFLGKPRLRGWIHVYAAVIAAIAGAALVSVSWALQGTRAGLATMLYTFTIVAMFTVSGTYHRVNWKSQRARKWMKRADHSMIFIFIAGSYTPFALLALPSEKGMVLFWIVWGGALAGVLLKCFWPSAPRWVGVPLYILLGWVAAWFIGPIMDGAGV